MNATKQVWPTNKEPDKREIERMYKCAYYLDRSFFRPEDMLELGIDVLRLKEFGEVVMKKPLSHLRTRVGALWERMSRAQRTMFLYTYYVQGVKHLQGLLSLMEGEIGSMMTERHGLSSFLGAMFRRFPEDLQKKLKDGVGKEWGLS